MNDVFQSILQSAEFGEEHFVAGSQARLAEMLDEKGISRAELARKLGVSRPRVTQIFSDDATNFTLRLLARSFIALGEEPVILTRKEYDRLRANAEPDASRGTLRSHHKPDPLSAALIAELLRASDVRGEPDRPNKKMGNVDEWAKCGSNVVPLRMTANG